MSATRLFTNRMKLGEFDPNSNVPWLTQAQARVQSYGVFPWVNSNANNAETETPPGSRSPARPATRRSSC